MLQNGKPTQSTDYLVRNGIGRFRYSFPRKPSARDGVRRPSSPTLAADPHLAIYWLLHTTVLADEDTQGARRRGDRNASAIRSCARSSSGSASLPLAGDLPVVPDFRARRSLATTYGAFEVSPDELPAASLRALELSPATRSLHNALQVAAGIDRGLLEPAQVAAAMVRIPESSTGHRARCARCSRSAAA